MPSYTFRCPEHGDFAVDQPMAETTPFVWCYSDGHRKGPGYVVRSAKVLGGAFHFPYGGRGAFHDGPDGTGETVRETAVRWQAEARAAGLSPEPVHQGSWT
jgi:hypothetical protein